MVLKPRRGERNRIEKAVHLVLQRLGFDIIRYRGIPSFSRSEFLAASGIGVVFDVGANTGEYAQELRKEGYRGRIVSFEPLSSAFAILAKRAAGDRAWECVHTAVGAAESEGRINVAANSLSSSLLPMTDGVIGGEPSTTTVREEIVRIAPLDVLRRDFVTAQDRLFLKIDVQGFERSVLLGAEETLLQVHALQVELTLVPLYEGQALIHELLAHLHSRGFDLVGLQPGFRDLQSGELLEVDGLFRRRSSSSART